MPQPDPGFSDETPPHAHLVQLYDTDDRALIENVGRYVCESLQRGGGAIIIATPEHRTAFAREVAQLDAAANEAVAAGRFVLLDAEETLARFMVDGQPDWERFASTIEPALADLRERSGAARLRAYGEMVGVLWQAGHYAAAIRLEEFWNRLLSGGGFELFCAYPIDVFGDEFRDAEIDAVLRTHTHLVPADDGQLQRAVHRAMDEVLGQHAEGVRRLVDTNDRPAWAAIPNAEAVILWLRNNLPAYADEILTRARRHYVAAA